MAIQERQKKKFNKAREEFKDAVRRQERKDAFLRITGISISLTSIFWDTIAQHAQIQYAEGVSGIQGFGIVFGIVMFILGVL